MSDKKRCPKCKTGIANPHICDRCGINVTEYERHGEERPRRMAMESTRYAPRPGGNGCAG
jgi:hypothetical protein